MSKAKYNTIPVEVLRRLYVDQNMTIREIEKELGVSNTPIRRALHHYGIPVRKGTPRIRKVGPLNPAWRGAEAKYSAKHTRVSKLRGRPAHCQQCGTTVPSERYEWANLTGKFDDPTDYMRVCKRCHVRIDDIYARRRFRNKLNAYNENRSL